MFYRCSGCGRRYEMDELVWRCRCTRPLELAPLGAFDESHIADSEPGVWRYAAALPEVPAEARVTIGERGTPLIRTDELGAPVFLKADFLFPTGSYKDRGACVLTSFLRSLDVGRIADDSSGNAGAAAAAYAAAADMECTLYVPAGNSPSKLAQIRAYGAELVEVDGDRAAASKAVADLPSSVFYASHNWHPIFHAGVATLGFEIWEQLDARAPSSIVAPAGNGSIILGCFRAFEMLAASGAVDHMPRLYAVQATAFPALAEALEAGSEEPTPTRRGETIAEGIAAEAPARGREVLKALRDSQGGAVTVTDQEIVQALVRLGRAGHYVEPTAAVGAAGFLKLLQRGEVRPEEPNVVVLTGTGLKSGERIAALLSSPPGV